MIGKITVVDDELKVIVKSDKKSIFSKVFKFNYYDLNYNYCGNYISKKINKKCG